MGVDRGLDCAHDVHRLAMLGEHEIDLAAVQLRV